MQKNRIFLLSAVLFLSIFSQCHPAQGEALDMHNSWLSKKTIFYTLCGAYIGLNMVHLASKYSTQQKLERAMALGTPIAITDSQPGQPASFILFAHGIGANIGAFWPYHEAFELPFRSFNFIDGERGTVQACLGQEHDIKTLAYQIHSRADQPMVLMGVSRGASTIINYAATQAVPEYVKALIIESPFDDMLSVINKKLGYFSYVPGLNNVMNISLQWLFKNYDAAGIQPIMVAKNIPHHLPVLIICSHEDALIPASSSQRLYEKLIAANHPHCYFLVTDHGSHARIIYGPDRQRYIDVVQAFYRKCHGLANEQDEKLLDECRA